MNKLKSIYASAYSASFTIIALICIILKAEFSATFKNWLTAFTGHHWITKSFLSILLFVLFFFLFWLAKKSVNEKETKKALILLELCAIAGFFGILGFYMFEFFKH